MFVIFRKNYIVKLYKIRLTYTGDTLYYTISIYLDKSLNFNISTKLVVLAYTLDFEYYLLELCVRLCLFDLNGL